MRAFEPFPTIVIGDPVTVVTSLTAPLIVELTIVVEPRRPVELFPVMDNGDPVTVVTSVTAPLIVDWAVARPARTDSTRAIRMIVSYVRFIFLLLFPT